MKSSPTTALAFLALLSATLWVLWTPAGAPETSPDLLEARSQTAKAPQPDLPTGLLPLPEGSRAVVVPPQRAAPHATSTGPSDLDWVPEEIEESPEDPVQLGDCGLFLTIVREQTLEPVASHAWLVRLDAPANETWSRGDQVQAKLEVPRAGVWIPNLPSGLYRVACWEQPDGQPDPAPFLVTGARTAFQVVLPTPAPRPVRLRVFDELGSSVETVFLVSAEPPASAPKFPEVNWLQQRTPLEDGVYFESFSGEPSFSSDDHGQPIQAVAGVFELGRVSAPTRGQDDALVYSLKKPGHSRIVVSADWKQANGCTWGAVQVPLATIEAALWLASGERPNPANLTIDATCFAEPIADEVTLEPGRHASLDVKVRYHGFEALEFHWTPADGILADQVLRPVSVSSD